MSLHERDERLEAALLEAARKRLAEPPELGSTMRERPAPAVTPGGLGAERAAALLLDVVMPAAIQIDHPRYFAFIPAAPAPAAALADVLLAVNAIYGGSWIEATGVVHAENEALAWLASLAGFPDTAGGCFVQGGTNGNLSALHAAREQARHAGKEATHVACHAEVHSSVRSMARIMDAEVLPIPGDRLTGEALEEVLHPGVFAVVATAGTTNVGTIDDLAGVAAVCADHDVWLHVDGAYGLGALCAPSARPRFAGLERADSFIVDPHKWLFSPFDSCALVYRDPSLGRAAHRQHASYLEGLYADDDAFNPSDYGVHLTRRARGLPLWFALAVHGTDAFAQAVERTLETAREAAAEIGRRPELELVVEPELTVLAFRRLGWAPADYQRWAEGLRASGTAFLMPTTVDDVKVVLDAAR